MGSSLKKRALVSTAWKFSERIIAQGVSMLVSIILARILSPNDYGIVSIVMIFFAFADIIISGGLNTALIQKKDADEHDYTAALVLTIVVSLVIYCILFFTAPFISRAYNQPELVGVFRIMGIILPVMAVKSILCAYISANLQFKKFFFATIGGTLTSAVIGITMALKGCGPWSLVAQQMSNTLIDTIILVLVTKVKLSKTIQFKRIVPLFKFGFKVLVSSFIDTAYMQLNPLFIGIRYSSADLSFYTKGKSFPNTISSTLTNTISAVLFPVLSKVQDERDLVLKYVRLYIRTSSFFVFPMMLGLLAASNCFIEVLLTDKWIEAAVYVKVFCIASMFDMVASGNCQAMKAIGRSDIFLKVEIIKKTSYFIVIGIFLLISNSPITLAISMLICTLISIVINTFPNRKLIGYSYRKQISDLLPNLVIASLMAFVVYLMNYIEMNKLLLLLIQIISGMLIYVLLSVITKNKSFKYVLATAKEMIKK